jgi:hypothetical protein
MSIKTDRPLTLAELELLEQLVGELLIFGDYVVAYRMPSREGICRNIDALAHRIFPALEKRERLTGSG